MSGKRSGIKRKLTGKKKGLAFSSASHKTLPNAFERQENNSDREIDDGSVENPASVADETLIKASRARRKKLSRKSIGNKFQITSIDDTSNIDDFERSLNNFIVEDNPCNDTAEESQIGNGFVCTMQERTVDKSRKGKRVKKLASKKSRLLEAALNESENVEATNDTLKMESVESNEELDDSICEISSKKESKIEDNGDEKTSSCTETQCVAVADDSALENKNEGIQESTNESCEKIASVPQPGRKYNYIPGDARYHKKYNIPLKKIRKSAYDPEEEARLEKIIFGDSSDVINNLPDNDFIAKSKKDIRDTVDRKAKENEESLICADDSDVDKSNRKKLAWTDEDDANYTVEAALNAQNRKLPVDRPEKLYTELLQNKYKSLVGTPKWAEIDRDANDSDDSDHEILKHSSHIKPSETKSLPQGTIEIKALRPINKETHNEGPIVTSLEFHPTSTVALVAGSSGILSLFQVDGKENSKLHSMLFRKFPISKATFLKDGDEVFVGSAFSSYCNSYNLISGKTYNIPLPHGITNMKRYEVSPDGKLIALCGRWGEIYLLTSSTKECIGTLKMNHKCTAIAFTPDNKRLITHGEGNDMYVWDVNSRSCIHRPIDDGCLSCASIAISPNGQFVATGSKQGVVNLYNTDTILTQQYPQPLKIVLNLVTSITAIKFNPTSEILAMASDKKINAFKMLHIPSFDVFSNFPTFQTKLGMPGVINFSPNSGYIGISNKSHSAFLYRLKHYGNY